METEPKDHVVESDYRVLYIKLCVTCRMQCSSEL